MPQIFFEPLVPLIIRAFYRTSWETSKWDKEESFADPLPVCISLWRAKTGDRLCEISSRIVYAGPVLKSSVLSAVSKFGNSHGRWGRSRLSTDPSKGPDFFCPLVTDFDL